MLSYGADAIAVANFINSEATISIAICIFGK